MTKATKFLIAVITVIVLLWAGGQFVALYPDYLWFDSLGYGSVFLTELWAKIVLAVIFFFVTGLWLALNVFVAGRLSPGRYIEIKGLPWVLPSPRLKRLLRIVGGAIIVVVALGFAQGASSYWYTALQYMNGPSFEWKDPILGHDASFYVFTLPAIEIVKNYLLTLMVLGAVAATIAYIVGGAVAWPNQLITRPASIHLSVLGALFLAVFGVGYWLDRYGLLFGSRSVVSGAGYVDVGVRMPILAVLAVASLVAAVLLVIAALKMRPKVAFGAIFGLVALHVAALWSAPSFVQRFSVEPNEIVYEAPYIENNIKATRFAFDLADVEVQPYAATSTLTLKGVRDVPGTVDNVRIWDWRVLKDTYNQIEALRPYYRFNDVDVDRYYVDGRYRQVALAVRELDSSLLSEDSRTWVNLHLLYTHGYGVVMSPVNAVTPEGLPEVWVGNIPPQSKVGIEVQRPAIYFGELTRNYVFVGTLGSEGRQPEFDYPRGADNRYTKYAGADGVPIDSLARRLLFALYFGDWNVLLTDSFTSETRVLWLRQVRQRVQRLAPFFEFDRDPYPVIVDGRIVWVIDAYTRTNQFPYSAAVRQVGREINYIRNPVKAVVDAYDGSVTFYVVDPQDPLTLVARTIFPDLFKDIEQMPEALRAHMRYPEGLFDTQAQQYLAYHMTDPRIFYNKEDLWQQPVNMVASADVLSGEQRPESVPAYYFIMSLPGQERPEYLVMLPFTPARKDNMAGWMAGRCDGKEYGKVLCYTFSKDHLVFGPNQIEARINQNDKISEKMTLWNQHGSRVIRGNLLVIPVGDAILYIEPLYLKSENVPLPELKRVIAAFQDRVAMGSTLNEALDAVFGGAAPVPAEPTVVLPPKPSPETPRDLWARALELYEKSQKQRRDEDWGGFGQTQKELSDLLHKMGEPQKPK